MKKIVYAFFSMLSTVILLSLFAFSIGYATFFENEKGTELAKAMIYNAKWFECLLVLLVTNLIGSIFRYKLVDKHKWSILLFHLAFICMIAGAAVTRYTGFEGFMHIRQGESSNEITSDKTSVTITLENSGYKIEQSTNVVFSSNSKNHFSESASIAGKKITVNQMQYLPHSIETIVPDEEGGPAISLLVMDGTNRVSEFILMSGETTNIEAFTFGFMSMKDSVDLLFTMKDKELFFQSTFPLMKSSMTEQTNSSIQSGVLNLAERKIIYRSANFLFVLKSFLPKAKKNLIQATQNGMGTTTVGNAGKNAITFSVSDGITTKLIHILESENESSMPAVCYLNDTKVSLSYGKSPHKLPFSIKLRKFEVERYPGSNSPSSFASEITLTDNERQTITPFRIYMNNILKYRGYRFFQASYDRDEMGTVLSVSHDFGGTFISYSGYLLMLIGMLLTLFNKKSRFRTLMKLSKDLQIKRKTAKVLLLPFLLFLSMGLQASDLQSSKKEHIRKLSALLIQDEVQGRIEPLNTYASDLFRKISKMTSYGEMSPTEVLLGMCTAPEHWKNEPMIKVANTALGKELGAVNDYVSFNQLFDFDNDGQYRLYALVEKTYQKEQTARNKYDKEIINVDERVNICYQIFTGQMLTIFPLGQMNGKWYAVPTGEPVVKIAQLMLNSYFEAVNQAQESGNWNKANEALLMIKTYQQNNGGEILPSEGKINLEILYNNLNLFGRLAILYVLMGVLLLILHIINIFNYHAKLDSSLWKSTYFFSFVFVIYTAGIFLRWYISGHAPWSNGYETIVFVGWAAGLSGLLFVRRSPVTLAITSLLSAIALFVAGMSWMNPEITNLVPVLKSYWLVLHVAVITSSYGFFAMSALMGLLNLALLISRTKKNVMKLNESIQEFSYIIEMALYIGLLMLTVGTFLGAVWANESWGRYWGWDPKETWALVSILVYAVILHLRKVPGLNNQLVLSILSLLSFSTVIMTFFGVNYYLSGMHSYAQGTPPPVPVILYFVLAGIFLVVAIAVFSDRKVKKWKVIDQKH